ncbi:hypothetical protein C9374_014535 [Naegleria lovaniensis]|uniref:ORC1/DEAH AAA+ ATPase domain-containing protein n=1 Tax=Naegleria lovaniensis TaxID=51637 RepID=A0AA88GUJ0_NAELO|nr:uncharacterized protein C9374_014535 [Naegleria lovaniensis]KAG2389135.1 hypothetical protein C9374_014535 [Naegleria lovaniensis]
MSQTLHQQQHPPQLPSALLSSDCSYEEPFQVQLVYKDQDAIINVYPFMMHMEFGQLIEFLLHDHLRRPIPKDISSISIRYYSVVWGRFTSAYSSHHLPVLWENVRKARNSSEKTLELIESTNISEEDFPSERMTLNSPSKLLFSAKVQSSSFAQNGQDESSAIQQVAVEACGSPLNPSTRPSSPLVHHHDDEFIHPTIEIQPPSKDTFLTPLPENSSDPVNHVTSSVTTTTTTTTTTTGNQNELSTTPIKSRRRRTKRVKKLLDPSSPMTPDNTTSSTTWINNNSTEDNNQTLQQSTMSSSTTTSTEETSDNYTLNNLEPSFETHEPVTSTNLTSTVNNMESEQNSNHPMSVVTFVKKSKRKHRKTIVPEPVFTPCSSSTTTHTSNVVAVDDPSIEPIIEKKTSRMKRGHRRAKSQVSDSQTSNSSSDSTEFEIQPKKSKANPIPENSTNSQSQAIEVDIHQHSTKEACSSDKENKQPTTNDMMKDEDEMINSSQQEERPQIFSQRVEIFSRKMECDSITNFIETQYFDHDMKKNVLYVYGTNGQGKSMVVSTIFNSVVKVDKYKFNLAGYAKGSDLLLLLFQNIVKGEISKRSELASRLLNHFNNRKKPILLYLDEFSFARHCKYLDQIRKSKIIVIAVTNDPPTKSALPYSLTFNQYESEDIKKILISEYEGKISAEIFDKMMNYLKNKQDLRQIKSFVDGHLMPEAKTLTVKRMLQLCNVGFRKKHDPLKGLTQTAIEVLVVLSCVAAEQEKFYGEIDAETFQRKYEQVLQEDFRKNFRDIKEGLTLLSQEGHITRKNVAGDVILHSAYDVILSSDNVIVKRLLANSK